MKLFEDERAENPIEVLLYVILAIAVMAFLMISVGSFLDAFDNQIDLLAISNPLSSWGTGMMATYKSYITYAYAVPSIFLAIVMIWGVRAVIRKHEYTTAQDQPYNNTEEY